MSLIFEIRKFLKFFHIFYMKELKKDQVFLFNISVDSTNFSASQIYYQITKIFQLSLSKIRN